jgi:hypothetical protein
MLRSKICLQISIHQLLNDTLAVAHFLVKPIARTLPHSAALQLSLVAAKSNPGCHSSPNGTKLAYSKERVQAFSKCWLVCNFLSNQNCLSLNYNGLKKMPTGPCFAKRSFVYVSFRNSVSTHSMWSHKFRFSKPFRRSQV